VTTADVTVSNNTGGIARIILFHKNTTDPATSGSWVRDPGLIAGPLSVQFTPGSGAPDEVAIVIQVRGGATPGLYVSAGNTDTDSNWVSCQFQEQDATGVALWVVSAFQFDVILSSGTYSCAMTQLAPYAPITHVFVVMLENHSFDNVFAFSGIDGITHATTADSNAYGGKTYPVLDGGPPEMPTDPGHEFLDVVEQLAGQNAVWPEGGPYPPIDNSGFVANYATTTTEGPAPEPKDYGLVMACLATPFDLPVTYKLATEFAVCDHWFSSMPGPTWPNRFFVHGASSAGLDDTPSSYCIQLWENVTGFVYPNGSIYAALGQAGIPYALYQDYTSDFLSMFNAHPEAGDRSGAVAQVAALADVALVRVNSLEDFADDLQGLYPYPYTFIEPHYGDPASNSYVGGSSQHPKDGTRAGELLLSYVCKSISQSLYWATSLVIITYDEHGGFYDSVAPKAATPPGDNPPPGYNQHGFTFDLYGVRVPAVIVSPLIPAGTVNNTVHDHSSILRTVENLFGLAPLTQRDANANDLLHLTSLDTPRTDIDMKLDIPPRTGPPARPAVSPEERARLDAEPLPQKGNLLGTLHIVRKTEFELSGRTPAERAAIEARFKAIRTRGEARAYIASVMAKVKVARQQRKPAAPRKA
jgi:phospholipase C